jgi:hypothetical protein
VAIVCMMAVFLFIHLNDCIGQTTMADTRVRLPRQQTTIYDALNQVTRQTGYFFVYDSELIDNDKRIRIHGIDADLASALKIIIDDPGLEFTTMGNHILVSQRKEPESVAEMVTQENPAAIPDYFIVRGRVLDLETGMPLPQATISIPGKGVGIASNAEGNFLMRLSNTFLDDYLRVSYMGYKSRELPLGLLTGSNIDITMEADYISMQEVIIRYYDPDAIVKEALAKLPENYSDKPIYQVNFYREGVQRNKKLLNYSEAIFKVYKPAYGAEFDTDQVMLLKSRNIINADETDSLVLKIRAGVRSALELDIVKSIPVFLNLEYMQDNTFKRVDIVSKDSRAVYAIEFEQTNLDYLPVYRGVLYIDMENLAIIGADFEVHPKHIDKSSFIFLSQRSRKFNASFDRIYYSVSYQHYNGRYHLSHVRGDLDVRFRPRNKLFSNNYHVFLEMVVGQLDDKDVTRFSRKETLKTSVAFADQHFDYDYDFWGEYNIIAPENHIGETFSQIRSKIESVVNESP